MEISAAALNGVLILTPKVFEDSRGWFMETYSRRQMASFGADSLFVQENHSFSAKRGTLRGLHFQTNPHAQSKLVRCTRGRILDVAVDLRRGSPSFCKWISLELSAENKRQLFIPKGFAHGFVTLEDNTEIQYQVDDYYDSSCDRGIRYDDPVFQIRWPVQQPLLSEKDKNAPILADSGADFTYEGERN